MAQPPPSLRSRVLQVASATPSPTRKEARRAGVWLVAASVAVGVTIFEEVGGFAHGEGRPLRLTVLIAAGWVAVSMILTWLVVGRGGSTMSRRPALLLCAALASPLVVFLWMHSFYGTYTEPFERVGLRCLAYSLGIAALPLAAFLGLRRAVEPRYPAVLGAAAGATCACWAGALIDLWCPLTNTAHVLVGHIAPLLIAIAAGAVVGSQTLGARAFAPRR